MARKVNAFVMTACLLWAVEANAISGNDWRRMTRGEQASYVTGVVDAWENLGEAAKRLLAKEQPVVVTTFTNLVNCVQGMTHSQVAAIVQKHLENHPAEWHYAMASSIWVALHEVCTPKSK